MNKSHVVNRVDNTQIVLVADLLRQFDGFKVLSILRTLGWEDGFARELVYEGFRYLKAGGV